MYVNIWTPDSPDNQGIFSFNLMPLAHKQTEHVLFLAFSSRQIAWYSCGAASPRGRSQYNTNCVGIRNQQPSCACCHCWGQRQSSRYIGPCSWPCSHKWRVCYCYYPLCLFWKLKTWKIFAFKTEIHYILATKSRSQLVVTLLECDTCITSTSRPTYSSPPHPPPMLKFPTNVDFSALLKSDVQKINYWREKEGE